MKSEEFATAQMNNHNPFYSWMPKPFGVLILLLIFWPPSFSGGTYLGNISEMQSGLAIYSESVQMGNYLVFVGMCLFVPFMILYLKARRPKQVFLWGFTGLAVLNVVCATAQSVYVLFAACLLMGFVRIMMMLNCTFTLAPYLTGFNTLDMLTVEVDPNGPVGQKQDKTRSMLMPLLYMYILTIINMCNIIVTRIAYNYSWQYAYYLEIGLLLTGMLVVLLTMKDEPTEQREQSRINSGFAESRRRKTEGQPKKELFLMDWRRLPDMLLLGTSLVSLCYVMAYGKTFDWLSSHSIVLAIGICLISAGLFLLLQIHRKGDAYLPLSIFRYRNVWVAALLFVLFVVMNSSSVLTTTYAHIASPANDMQIGAQGRWSILGCVLGAMLAVGMVLKRVPMRIIFLVSFALMAVSNVLMYFTFQNETLLGQLALPIVLMNTGLIPLYALVAAYGMKGLPNHLLASLLFIMILMRNAIAPPVGSALYSNWLYQRQQYHEQRLIENYDALNIITPSQIATARRTVLIQSNLAAMKDITGKTIWLFLAIGIMVVVFPTRKEH